jgi:hypothetical protein
MDNYHLTNKNGEWNLKKEGSNRAVKKFDTKEQGRDYSTDYVRQQGGSLKIHKLDNSIQEERTYPKSSDPKKTKG